MHFFDQINRVEQVRFTGTGCAPAHIYSGDSPLAAQDNSTPGQRFIILGLTDFDPGDIRDRVIQFHMRIYFRLLTSSRNSSHSSLKK